jgi:creatinine deaminase
MSVEPLDKPTAAVITTVAGTSGMDGDFVKRGIGLAIAEARAGFAEGGIPIGSALLLGRDVVAVGRNQRVQRGSQILHAEMACIESAGRRNDFYRMTLFTTLSPCMMCAGAVIQFGIKSVVIGENRNFGGNEGLLADHGVNIEIVDSRTCRDLLNRFIKAHPEIWYEDIGKQVR